MRKSKTVKGFNNFKMTENVYKLRRIVLKYIYELKNEGLKLPRVDVRVGNATKCQTLGIAKLKKNIIFITEKAIEMKDDEVRVIVYHELLHAILGQSHVKGCPIMNSVVSDPIPKMKAVEIFKKYYNKVA